MAGKIAPKILPRCGLPVLWIPVKIRDIVLFFAKITNYMVDLTYTKGVLYNFLEIGGEICHE